MIDKVDLRVARNTPFTPEFKDVYENSGMGARRPWARNGYFASRIDLRPYGYDALLHMSSTMTRERFHKLEIYDAGDKTLAEMRQLIVSIFDVNADPLKLMRVDLCVDVSNVPVGWFKRHTMVRSKQTNREFGVVQPYMTMQQGQAETLYAGVKPNQYRFYNKSLERLNQWRRQARQLAREGPDLTPTPFEVLYGHSADAVITRVERQLTGRDLASFGLTDFKSLENTPNLSPFDAVVFLDADTGEPSIKRYSFRNWTSGMFLRQKVCDIGLPATRAWMRQELGRSFYREWKRLKPFLHVQEETAGPTSEELTRAFQRSALKQIGLTDGIAAYRSCQASDSVLALA